MQTRTLLGLAIALLLAGSPAIAAESPRASFSINNIRFSLEIPPGYCEPEGAEIEAARVLAAGDQLNVTHLTLIPCESGASASADYILIKTPAVVLGATVQRGEFLQMLGDAFANTELMANLTSDRVFAESGRGVSEAFGTEVDLSGSIRPLGRDDMCGYIGGAVRVSSAAGDYNVSFGACLTAISGRIMSVYWYGPDRGSAGIADLLIKAKGLAQRIRPAS